jgi:hypothetical protein
MVLWNLFAKQDYHALHHYLFFYQFHLAETKVELNPEMAYQFYKLAKAFQVC